MAMAAEGRGYAPQYNEQIDLFFFTEDETILAEMKSCHQNNLHAQVCRGISQLFEYKYVYAAQLGDNVLCVLCVLVLESRPSERQRWLMDYVKSLGILLVWGARNEDRLETEMEVPQSLDGVVSQIAP